MIIHADMDAFFPSVEQVLDPELKGLPVIVGSRPGERGVVSSASYEARKFGVHAGMPSQKAGQLCPNGVFLHGNFRAYKHFSRLMRDIFLRYTDRVSMGSLDEAFLDMADCRLLYPDVRKAALEIQSKILEETGLTCSVGVASTRVVAKVASDFKKPRGLTYVAKGSEAKFLAPLPIRDLPGIGPKSAKQLHTLGIHNLGDIQNKDQKFFIDNWGKHGLNLWRQAHGENGAWFAKSSASQKSVSRETTFPTDTDDLKKLRITLVRLVERAVYDLRNQGMKAREIKLKIRYHDFTTITSSKKLMLMTDTVSDLLREAKCLFKKTVNNQKRLIRLIGVGFSNLENSREQSSIFDMLEGVEQAKHKRLNQSVDNIREKFGYQALDLLGTHLSKES